MADHSFSPYDKNVKVPENILKLTVKVLIKLGGKCGGGVTKSYF